MQVDVEVVAGAAGVGAEEAGLVGFLDGSGEDSSFVVEFAPDVDVGCGALYNADVSIWICKFWWVWHNIRSSSVRRQDSPPPVCVDPSS